MAISSEPDPNASNPGKPWAARFFAYDRLALVNRAAFESIGGWDSSIPYYHTDCDMHDRLKMYGFEYNDPEDVEVGFVKDVAHTLDDLLVLYRKKGAAEASFTVDNSKAKTQQWSSQTGKVWEPDVPGSPAYHQLLNVTEEMVEAKNAAGRNIWQGLQKGGHGEPYYRDANGFDRAIQMMTDVGKAIYAEKWGYRECGLLQVGRKAGDEWKAEHN